MKRTFICIFLLIASVISGLAVNRYNEENVTSVLSDINEIRQRYDSGKDTKQTAERAVRRWQAFCADNIFLTNNECALEVNMALIRILSVSENNDNDLIEECGFAEQLIRSYMGSVSISLTNIF